MDRKPHEGWESETFTYKPANEFDEHWVAIDVPAARKLANELLDALTQERFEGILSLP